MFSAGRGLALILVAIGIGILLLYVVDDGTSGPADDAALATTTTAAPAETEDDAAASAGETTETTEAGTARAAAAVTIKVYNASGEAGVAGSMTDQLDERGYTNALAPGNLAMRDGSAVACRAGFDGADAAALAAAVGDDVAVEEFPDPPPADAGDADCIVILGR